MSDYLAFKNQELIDSGKPGTYAIVIGVGSYPHLLGGKPNKLTDMHGGMKQLTSPPVSAREFCNWLLDEFNNLEKPLASLSLLTSEENANAPYEHSKAKKNFSPKTANIEHVKKAIREWKELADSNEENMILFFFCGHGVARGLDGLTLLLEDYGEHNSMPMEGALDFAALHRGMSQCAASHQCFFIDACRSVSEIVIETTANGQAVIMDNIRRDWDSDWNYAIFYSTLEGKKAYGRTGKPSYYTEELIVGLNGTGSNNRNDADHWWVSTGDLSIALNHGLSLRGKKSKVPLSALVHFDFHQLTKPPVVPVTVSCESKNATEQASFLCSQNGTQLDSRLPQEGNWVTQLSNGTYDFSAELDSQSGARNGEIVMPPYRNIKIKLEETP